MDGLGAAHARGPCRFRRRRHRTESPPSDSSPLTPTPCGISIRSSTVPLFGSMRRISLSSPSQVACQSSPSTQVTPVTKRFDSMVRSTLPGGRVDLLDLLVAVLARPTGCPRPRRGPSRRRGRARGSTRSDVAGGRDRSCRCAPRRSAQKMLAVEGGAGVAGVVERAGRLAARGIEGDQRRAGGGPDAAAVVADAGDLVRLRRRGRTRARSRPHEPALRGRPVAGST